MDSNRGLILLKENDCNKELVEYLIKSLIDTCLSRPYGANKNDKEIM